MVDFDQAHEVFFQSHLNRRSGERKGRLKRGHKHGEILFLKNVWWNIKGNLHHLHPEYEILDWRGKSYFADYAWLPPGPIKLLIEIKSYSNHVRDLDRDGYCRELNRELFNQAVGYRVISFAYDDVANRPELCITLLRLYISTHFANESTTSLLKMAETEILRLTFQVARPLRPIDVVNHLQINHRTAVNYMTSLCEKGWFIPIYGSSGKRIVRYELIKRFTEWE